MSFLPNSYSKVEWQDNSGFTLLEVLLSISILAIVSSVIYVSLFSSMDVMDATRTKLDHYELVRLVFSLIEQDLQGAYTSPYTDYYVFQGTNEEHDGQPADRLYFLTTSHRRMLRDAAEGDLCEVDYSLVFSNEENVPHRLFRRTDPTPDRDPDKGGTSWEIIDRVLGFNVEFYNINEWQNVWDGRGANFTLPSAVRITLTLALEDGSTQSFSNWINLPLAK
ncbi:prepilin-type N-terminal cleavage/methylation domain-containing protein [bacterium]|nr:prepilin-type N-terminal cleavage/methylation domain-containing protein [bacterium]